MTLSLIDFNVIEEKIEEMKSNMEELEQKFDEKKIKRINDYIQQLEQDINGKFYGWIKDLERIQMYENDPKHRWVVNPDQYKQIVERDKYKKISMAYPEYKDIKSRIKNINNNFGYEYIDIDSVIIFQAQLNITPQKMFNILHYYVKNTVQNETDEFDELIEEYKNYVLNKRMNKHDKMKYALGLIPIFFHNRHMNKWVSSAVNNFDSSILRDMQVNKKRKHSNLRKERIKNATPDWLKDRPEIQTQIDQLYADARQLTRDTGIKFAVDHVYPITHDDQTGLHLPCNMQIISKSGNSSKSNRLPNDTLSWHLHELNENREKPDPKQDWIQD